MEAPIATAPEIHLWPVLFKQTEIDGRKFVVRGHKRAGYVLLYLWQTGDDNKWRSNIIRNRFRTVKGALRYANTKKAWAF